MSQDATFYAVCSERYFPSVVALLNSLRLTGHRHELAIGDCGLTQEQRERLAPHCTIFEIPGDRTRDPVLLKPFAHLMAPTGVLVIIDSDMIVTGSLDGIINEAAEGRICAYPDPSVDRFFPEWERLFDLSRPPRTQPYVSTGFVAFSALHWPDLLGQWYAACEQVPRHRTLAQGAAYEQPIALGDQDALNAVLMSEVPDTALMVLPKDERPVWMNEWVELIDEKRLMCTYQGTPTKLLHADGIQKPWEISAWWRIQKDAYIVLMRRLIQGNDLTLSLDPSEVPIWLRRGWFGGIALNALNATHRVATAIVRHTPARAVKKWLIDRLEHRAGLARTG